MSIAIRANQSGVDQAAAQKAAEKKGHQNVVKSVNAGGFLRKNDTQSQIEARRNNAKKQALKVVSDAWKSDNKSADSIADMEGLKQSKVSEMNEIRAKMKDIENTKKSLQEEYGVADGSQEQKDLELLEKYQNNMNGSSYDQFSDEELSRLKELQNAPLTEYQKKVLNLNSMKGQVSVEADRKQFEVNALTASISDATLEQLKSRDMEKASDAADEIMDSPIKRFSECLSRKAKTMPMRRSRKRKRRQRKRQIRRKNRISRSKRQKRSAKIRKRSSRDSRMPISSNRMFPCRNRI